MTLFCSAEFSVYQFTPVAARPRASLSLPRESDKERPGSPPGPRAGRQPSSGGAGAASAFPSRRRRGASSAPSPRNGPAGPRRSSRPSPASRPCGSATTTASSSRRTPRRTPSPPASWPGGQVRELCFVNRKSVPRSLFSVLQCFLFIRLFRSHRRSGPHFLCREKVTKSGRGAPRTPVRGDSLPAGGVGPACRSIRGRIRASTGPLVGLALPAPLHS